MLTVCLSVSIWWMMLALIPLAVILLAASTILPQQGKMHDAYERIVRTILFSPIPGVPNLSFIKFVLVGLGVVAAFVGLSVFNDGSRALPPNSPLDKQLLFQVHASQRCDRGKQGRIKIQSPDSCHSCTVAH